MYCADCDVDDPAVLVRCRDGITRCAHHAIIAGFCADCGEGDPQPTGDDMTDGLCHDCASAEIMRRRRIVQGIRARLKLPPVS